MINPAKWQSIRGGGGGGQIKGSDHTTSEEQLGNDPPRGGGADRRTRSHIKIEFLGEFEVVFETAQVFWTGKTSMKKKKRIFWDTVPVNTVCCV